MTWMLVFLVGVTIPEAEAALQAGRYQEALQKFEELYALDPTNPRIVEGLARSYEGMGQYDEALLQYTSLYQMDPANSRYRRKTFQLAMLLARQYRNIRDWNQARTYLELAVEVNPRDPTAWFWFGYVQERLGQRRGAIRAYTRAAQLGSEDARKALHRLNPPQTAGPPEEDTAPSPTGETLRPKPETTADSLSLLIQTLKESLATLILHEQYQKALILADSILRLNPNDLDVVNLRLQLRGKLQGESEAQKTRSTPVRPQEVSPSSFSWMEPIEALGSQIDSILAPYPPWMVYGGGGFLIFLLLLTWLSIRRSSRPSRAPVHMSTSFQPSSPSPPPSPPSSPSSGSVSAPSPPTPSSPPPPPSSQPQTQAPPPKPTPTPTPPPQSRSRPTPRGEVDEVWATNLEEAMEIAQREENTDFLEEKTTTPKKGNPKKMISALILIAMGRKQGGFQKDLTHGVFFGPGGYILHAQWGDIQGEEALIKIIEEVDPDSLKFVPGAIPPVGITMKMSPKKLREFLKRYQEG